MKSMFKEVVSTTLRKEGDEGVRRPGVNFRGNQNTTF